MAAPWEEYAGAASPAALGASAPWEEYASGKVDKPAVDQAKDALRSLYGGAIRGAGSIGATILAPVDWAARKAGIENDFIGRTDRREAMDAALKDAGADPESLLYKGGKLAAEIAGTAGAGGALANGLRAVAPAAGPAIQGIARGLETGGFRVGPLAGPAGVAARIGTGAAVGGVSAGMVNPTDAGAGALIGGAMPGVTQLAGNVGGSIRQAIAPNVSPEVRDLAQRAADLGINIPADRLTDSKPLNALAASLNYVPLSGRAATEDAMLSQLNQKLSNTFGQDTSNVTMALRKADDTLGGKFDSFLQANKVKMTPQFDAALKDAEQQATSELGTEGASIIKNQIQAIRDKAASGEIDGQAAYNIKKTLDRIGRRSSPEGWYALDLKGKLMDALNESVGPQKALEFGTLRKQYGNMLSIQKLAKNGAEGEVSAARLANMQNINNKDVQELADIAAQFVKPREGAHGAAQRVSIGGATAALGGWLGGPAGAAVGAGGLMAGGRVANGLLNSQMARNFVLNRGSLLGEPQSLGLLTQGAYHALPLVPAE